MTATRTKRKDLVSIDEARLGVNEGLVDAVIEIGKQRAGILEAMKEALLCGDDAKALEHARELTGLPSKRASSAR